MEFLQYPYLQTGRVDLALAVADEAKTIRGDELSPRFERTRRGRQLRDPDQLQLASRAVT